MFSFLSHGTAWRKCQVVNLLARNSMLQDCWGSWVLSINAFGRYFDYLFYVDFEASMADQRSQNALRHLQVGPS